MSPVPGYDKSIREGTPKKTSEGSTMRTKHEKEEELRDEDRENTV